MKIQSNSTPKLLNPIIGLYKGLWHCLKVIYKNTRSFISHSYWILIDWSKQLISLYSVSVINQYPMHSIQSNALSFFWYPLLIWYPMSVSPFNMIYHSFFLFTDWNAHFLNFIHDCPILSSLSIKKGRNVKKLQITYSQKCWILHASIKWLKEFAFKVLSCIIKFLLKGNKGWTVFIIDMFFLHLCSLMFITCKY